MKRRIGLFVGILIAALCCAGLYQLHLTRKAGFVLEKHLDDTLLWIGDDKIPLREAVYYIALVENQSSERAEGYSEKAQKSFWNIKTGDEGYVSQVAKKVILEQLIIDELMYREAVENGWNIDETEVDKAAMEVWAELSPYQKELSGYTKETIRERMKKAYAGQVYGEIYIYGATKFEDMEELKKNYGVKVDDRLWSQIAMGSATRKEE